MNLNAKSKIDTSATLIYTMSQSLYITAFYKRPNYNVRYPIVAFGDNVLVKFEVHNKNLQELFNEEYGLENLHIKIDYDNPYSV
jgi:hypothetical protein